MVHGKPLLTIGSTCIVSVLRLVWIYPISITTDVTYESPLSALWSNVELNVGILCSCLPTLRSCMTRLFPRLFPATPSSNHGVPTETKPDSSGYDSKRATIQEIALPQSYNDLEDQRISNDHNGNDQHIRPFSFLANKKQDNPETMHLTALTSHPPTPLTEVHARKASLPERKSSLPERVARWRESQGQKLATTSQQPYPNNDSMKNLLSEENETTLPMPEPSRSRDGY